MKDRTDTYEGAWIQGGTARIPARGEPFGGPLLFDDTPPEIKEHRKREELKEGAFFGDIILSVGDVSLDMPSMGGA